MCRISPLASPYGGGGRAKRGRRGYVQTLSVSFADSSPKGRDKRFCKVQAFPLRGRCPRRGRKRRRPKAFEMQRVSEPKRGGSSERTTLLLISRLRRQLPLKGKPRTLRVAASFPQRGKPWTCRNVAAPQNVQRSSSSVRFADSFPSRGSLFSAQNAQPSSSVRFADSYLYPLCPFGTFPPDRGDRPHKRKPFCLFFSALLCHPARFLRAFS